MLLNRQSPESLVKHLQENSEKLVLLYNQPTCENMFLDIRQRIQQQLAADVKLYSLLLSETENSFAEWYASDN